MKNNVIDPESKTKPFKTKKILGVGFNNIQVVMPDDVKETALPESAISKKKSIASALLETDASHVIKATVNAFGVEAIPTVAITSSKKHDVNLEIAKDNFTFDQLFKDFDCDNLDLFVFDDVVIHVREKKVGDATVDVTRFNGTLKLDQAPLNVFKDFLKAETGILVAGKIETSGEDISQKISPSAFTLTSSANFLIQLADGIILKSAVLQLDLVRKEDDPQKWTLKESVSGTLQINRLGTPAPLEINATVTCSDGTLNVAAETDNANGLFGLQSLSLENVSLEFNVGQENNIEIAVDLRLPNITFHLAGMVSPAYAGVKANISQFGFNELNNLFRNFTGTDLATPDFNIDLSDVYIGLATDDCTVDSSDLKKGFSIGCSVNVRDVICKTSATVSTSGIEFTGSLENLSIGPVDITKAQINLGLNTASSGKPGKFEIMGQTLIEGLALDCKVAYQKNTDATTNTLVYASIAAGSFGMSTLFPQTSGTFVDSLRFSKVAFIYSSDDNTTEDPDFQFKVRKGLQLIGVLDEIPALTNLTNSKKTGLVLSAHYGTTTDISIEIPDTRLDLGSSVICDAMRIGIELVPQPALNLIFGMEVQVPKQTNALHFDLMLEVGLAEARGSATMKGYWVNPFGVNGLQIGPELALQLGIIYAEFFATGLPSEFGFAGGIKLGDVSGEMALNISEDPTHEILMGEIKKLSPQNLVSFVNTLTGMTINPSDVPEFFDLEELKLFCAPTGGSIGTLNFEPGFSFAADLVLFDKRINVYALVNDTGIIAKGELDKIEFGPLKIKGAHDGNAKLNLELTPAKQSVFIDGAFEFLGTGKSIYLDVSNKGITFELEEKFLNLLKYIIRVKSEGSFTDPANLDFSFYAEFDNDLTDYIKTTVVQKINEARRAVDTSIEDAQKQVDKAEKDYMAEFAPAQAALDKARADADAYLASCTKEVDNQKAVWDKKINDAQADLDKAKTTYNNAFTDASNKVAQAERDYNNAMRDAQSKVDQAQIDCDAAFNKAKYDAQVAINNYNASFGKAYSDLNSAQNTVNSLQNQINSLQHTIDNLAWYEKPAAVYYGSQLAGVWVAMQTARGVLTTCQAIVNGFQTSSVFVAKNTAQGVLDGFQQGSQAVALRGAKAFLDGLRYGPGYLAFQAAKGTLDGVRYGSQYAVWQTAEGTLKVAQTTGREALSAAEFTLSNIGSSVVYVTLDGTKIGLEAVKQGTAAAAFETSKGVLEGAKRGADGMLDLGAYIAAHVGDLLEVKKVTLSASLKGIEQGNLFIATFDGSVFGQSYNTTIDFNVKDATAFIEKLFTNVLDEAERIAKIG